MLEGLTFDNARITGLIGFGSGSRMEIRDNVIHYEGSDETTAAIDIRIEVDGSLLVEGNQVTSTGYGVYIRQLPDTAASVDIRRNTITTSAPALSSNGVRVGIGGGGDSTTSIISNVLNQVGGCSCPAQAIAVNSGVGNATINISHNTVFGGGNSSTGIDIGLSAMTPNAVLNVFNNTVSDSGRGYRMTDFGAGSLDFNAGSNNGFNNTIVDNVFGSPSWTPGNADPRFADADGGNFQLLPDSGLIDAGLTSASQGSLGLDAAGLTRLSGATVDIGALEFQAKPAILVTRRENFAGAAQAAVASAPYVTGNGPPEPVTSGDVLLDAVAPSTLFFGSWPADFPDDNDVELALNNAENLVITHIGSPVNGIGIEFDDASGGASPSTFVAAAYLQQAEVARFAFRAPGLATQDFVGIWSPFLMDELRLTEFPNANENEYFGRVFSSQTPASDTLLSDSFGDLCLGDDFFDDNDSAETARAVSLPFSREGLEVCNGDDDYFQFQVPGGDRLNITVSFTDAAGNVDIVLFEPSLVRVAGSSSTTDDENIQYDVPESGTYTLRVFAFLPDSQNRYDLSISSSN